MKLIAWIHTSVKATDMFPRSVQLSYKGNTHFKTTFGGVVSILIKILVVLYAIMLFINVVTKKNTTKSVTNIVKDLTKDSTKHYIGKGTFAFGVKLLGPSPERLLDPTYFNLEISQVKYSRADPGTGIIAETSTSIPYEYWGDNFPFVEQDLYDRIGLQTYLCPTDKDYFLSSNYNSDEFYTVRVQLSHWVGVGWQTQALIDSTTGMHFIEIALVNAYFDFDDYGSPIKTYYEDINFFYLRPEISYFRNVKVKPNTYESNNNLLYQSFTDKGSFYSIGSNADGYNLYSSTSGVIFSNNFILSQDYDLYERDVFTFFDMFGLLGGVYEICIITGSFLVNSLAKKLLHSSLLSNLYQVKVDEYSEIEAKKTAKVKPLPNKVKIVKRTRLHLA